MDVSPLLFRQLGYCNIPGQIPSELGNLGSLTYLYTYFFFFSMELYSCYHILFSIFHAFHFSFSPSFVILAIAFSLTLENCNLCIHTDNLVQLCSIIYIHIFNPQRTSKQSIDRVHSFRARQPF